MCPSMSQVGQLAVFNSPSMFVKFTVEAAVEDESLVDSAEVEVSEEAASASSSGKPLQVLTIFVQ